MDLMCARAGDSATAAGRVRSAFGPCALVAACAGNDSFVALVHGPKLDVMDRDADVEDILQPRLEKRLGRKIADSGWHSVDGKSLGQVIDQLLFTTPGLR